MTALLRAVADLTSHAQAHAERAAGERDDEPEHEQST